MTSVWLETGVLSDRLGVGNCGFYSLILGMLAHNVVPPEWDQFVEAKDMSLEVFCKCVRKCFGSEITSMPGVDLDTPVCIMISLLSSVRDAMGHGTQ